jgi:hypothetical protein
MAKRHEVFPSRFRKQADLAGKPVLEEIERAPQEEIGSGADKEVKTVLYFCSGRKPLPLNMTNWDSVAAIAGDDTVNWPGHRIELYPTTTTLRGNTVECIRIHAPRQKPPSPSADMDDDIPF